MSHIRLSAVPAKISRRNASLNHREAARRRSRPRLESLEGRLVLSGPGATLDVSSAPYYFQGSLPAPVVRPLDWAYGQAIAATPDGNVVAVSAVIAPDAPGSWATRGVVEVWERSGRDWSLMATLTPPAEELESTIGWDLAISDDGSTIVASAIANRAAPEDFSLLVYGRDGDGWSFRQDIDVPRGRGVINLARLNNRLTISGDGDVIALGTSWDLYDPSSLLDGVVRVFARSESGSTWEQTTTLTPPDPATAVVFGVSVEVSADGSTLAVGSAGYVTSGVGAANVFIYHAGAGGWGEPTALDASPPGDHLGESLSLSGDGRTLLASAIEVIPGGGPQDLQGAAYIYEDTGSGWVRSARFSEPQVLYGLEYGRWLGLSADGGTAVVGDVERFSQERMLYVYGRDSGWAREAVITPVGSRNEGGVFGGLAVADGDVFARSPRSTGFTVDVYHRPDGLEVVLDPTSQATTVGEPTTFLAAAAGADDLQARWQSSEDGGETWTDLVGAVNAWYTITPSPADSGRMFRAVFTDGDGATVVTRAATMTVTQATPVITVDYAPEGPGVNKMVRFNVRVASAGDNPNVPTGAVTLLYVDANGHVYDSRGVLNRGEVVLMETDNAPPGVYEVYARYDPLGDQLAPDPYFFSTSTVFTMVIPKAVPELDAALADPTPQYGEANQLIVRSATYSVGFGPTGLVGVWSGADFLGAAPFEWAPDGTYRQAVIPLQFKTAGIQLLQWSYVGDDSFESRSGMFYAEVDRAPTTIVATPTSGSVLSNYGDSTTWDVVVRRADGTPAVGWVWSSITGLPVGYPRFRTQTDAEGRALVTIPGGSDAGGQVALFEFEPTTDLGYSRYAVGVGVYKAATAMKLTTTSPTVLPGDPVTFVALVWNTAETISPRSGVVQFYVDGVLAGTAQVGNDFAARFTTTLGAGVHDVVAVFPETENFQGSVSNRVSQTVARNATVTELWSTRNPSTAGDSLEFRAAVNRVAEIPYAVTGVVRFYLGPNPIAEVPVGADGVAVLPARFDAAGTYPITAVYLGNREYDTSQSIHLTQLVDPRGWALAATTPPATTATSSPSTTTIPPAVAAEAARPTLTPAQARRAAFLSRFAMRRPTLAAKRR